jgi:hypothetical protein
MEEIIAERLAAERASGLALPRTTGDDDYDPYAPFENACPTLEAPKTPENPPPDRTP